MKPTTASPLSPWCQKKNSGRIQLEISVDFNQSWCGCNAVHTVVPTYCDMICGCVWQLEIHHPNGHEMSLRFYQQTNDRQWIDQNKHGEFNHEIVGLIMNRKGLNQNQVASKLEPHQPWTMVYHHQWCGHRLGVKPSTYGWNVHEKLPLMTAIAVEVVDPQRNGPGNSQHSGDRCTIFPTTACFYGHSRSALRSFSGSIAWPEG